MVICLFGFIIPIRNFVVNEVESDVVYLQNKTIGDNHTQMDPTYKYRAWYKAFTRIEIGYLVTPKTDPGNYVIEKTGDITVYAGESVVLKPGFHAQNGSKFHAFIKQDCKQPPENVPVYANLQELEKSNFNEPQLATATESGRFGNSMKRVVTDSTKKNFLKNYAVTDVLFLQQIVDFCGVIEGVVQFEHQLGHFSQITDGLHEKLSNLNFVCIELVNNSFGFFVCENTHINTHQREVARYCGFGNASHGAQSIFSCILL